MKKHKTLKAWADDGDRKHGTISGAVEKRVMRFWRARAEAMAAAAGLVVLSAAPGHWAARQRAPRAGRGRRSIDGAGRHCPRRAVLVVLSAELLHGAFH